jgi:hypothetical protein
LNENRLNRLPQHGGKYYWAFVAAAQKLIDSHKKLHRSNRPVFTSSGPHDLMEQSRLEEFPVNHLGKCN